MEMCILDSSECTEPGCFVFDDSYLILKLTGKSNKLNRLNSLMHTYLYTRFVDVDLLVYGTICEFLCFFEKMNSSLDSDFSKELQKLLKLNKSVLNLPKSGKLSLSKPLIMGVINATDDSFYNMSRVGDENSFVERVKSMIEEGVDIIDIGGESSRPGATPIGAKKEIQRVIPLIEKIRKFSNIPISVDTYRKITAERAINAGADIINDISALRFDEKMAIYAGKGGIPVILMHMKGTPSNMQKIAGYRDVIAEIKSFFSERIAFAISKGIKRQNIILDPGIGFGKKLKDNLQILKKIESFHEFRLPLLLGTSRKSFIGEVLNQKDPTERLTGTLGTTALGVLKGVQIFRVHDVKENRDIADLVFNIEKS